jgi:uroporphyrinogen-III synthase
MSLHIAITRAMPDAESTARLVRDRGATPIVAPLLRIAKCAYDSNVDGAQALLFTSAAGVRAFAPASRAGAIPAFCVGDATALAARAAGFADVRSADGDAAALAHLALTSLKPAGGPLIHIRGAHVAGDVAGPLQAAGFRVESRIAYTAAPVDALPAAYAETVDIILFYSARAALAFDSLGGDSAGRTAACLSQGVADTLKPGWARVIVAARPREDALLEAVFAS